MAYPHSMRLHGPWRCDPVARYVMPENALPRETRDDLPAPARLTAPADWSAALGADFRGRALFRRGFNRPTGLESSETLWLVIEGLDACGVVSLNGQRLGEVEGYALPREFDVTARLEPRNEVVLEIGAPGLTPHSPAPRPGREHLPGGPIRETRLEVRAASCVLCPWLCLQAAGDATQVRAGGNIVSREAKDLEILIRHGDAILLREPASAGRFEFSAPAAVTPDWSPGKPATLEPVELLLLLDGQSVWETTWLSAVAGEIRLDPQRVQPLAEVLSEASYTQFDQQGLAIAQALPAAWATRVGPRLAHHPCVVAWSAPPEQLASAPRDTDRQTWFGRPWVSQSDALGDRWE